MPFLGPKKSRAPQKVKILCKGPFRILEMAPVSDFQGLFSHCPATFPAQLHWYFYATRYTLFWGLVFGFWCFWEPPPHPIFELYQVPYICVFNVRGYVHLTKVKNLGSYQYFVSGCWILVTIFSNVKIRLKSFIVHVVYEDLPAHVVVLIRIGHLLEQDILEEKL